MDYRTEYIKSYKDKTRKYFIESYLSTFDASERKEKPFMLFPRQIELVKSFPVYNNIVTIKPRQSGITTVTSAWITGQIVFANPNSPETVLCIGNKLDISQQLLENVGKFLEQVPRWFWGGEYFSPDPESPKNKKSIFKTRNKQRIELFNGCKVYARSSGVNAARGIPAVSILVFDEAAFIQNGLSVYTQAVAATNTVANAKIIMISTPNGKDQLYYQTYSKAVKKENNYHVVEFRWFQDPRYNKYLKWRRKNKETGDIEEICDTIIDKKGNVLYDEEKWRKLEKDGWKPTSPWYENTCKSFNNDELRINQELNVSFLGSSDNVVPVEAIEMQLKKNVVNITDDWKLRDTLVEETWIWKDPIPGHRYICSCLPSWENVITENGLKQIKNVTINDKLYDKDGSLVQIKKIYKSEYENTIIGIMTDANVDHVFFTKNHPILTYDGNEEKFIHAEKVNSNIYIVFPNILRKSTYSIEYTDEFSKNGIFIKENIENNSFWEKIWKILLCSKRKLDFSEIFPSAQEIDLKKILSTIRMLPLEVKKISIDSLVNSEIKIKSKKYEIIKLIYDLMLSLCMTPKINHNSDNVYFITLDGDILFSNDGAHCFFKVKNVCDKPYNGYVYNFETETHTFCAEYIATHNCDGSSGAGEDFTAIQVIDVDAIDENGLPYFDQVLEYNGKVNGNEAGQLVYRYGKAYNDALIVVDGCGGYGDAICLTLMDLKYPNLYYDDSSIKNYTNENLVSSKNMGKEPERQLPGFRMSSMRLQLISNFVDLVKTNAFRIRSIRTISELETWVFKNGRPDHQDGCHDDLLTCLAMGLFIMQFYMLRRDKIKEKDKCIASSWVVNNLNNTIENKDISNKTINISDVSKKYNMPFYSNRRSDSQERKFMAMMMLGCIKHIKNK